MIRMDEGDETHLKSPYENRDEKEKKKRRFCVIREKRRF